MGTNNVVFLEVIEWFDETGKEIVHRIPEKGSGEIKYGAQLVVRESQMDLFFFNIFNSWIRSLESNSIMHLFFIGEHSKRAAASL